MYPAPFSWAMLSRELQELGIRVWKLLIWLHPSFCRSSYALCLCVCASCLVVFHCDPMDGSPPGTSAHGTSQTRILEWVVISFSRGSFLDLPDTGIETVSPASPALQADYLPLEPLVRPSVCVSSLVNVLTSWLVVPSVKWGWIHFYPRLPRWC